MLDTISLKVNGRNHTLEVDPETPLLYVLRNNLKLNGPKFGCGLGQCGSCMVLLDRRTVMSCQLPVKAVGDQAVTTLEGLISENGELHKIQKAFVNEQAAQCGYCMNGMIMAAVSLLDQNPDPKDQDIREHLQMNICRCGSHSRILKAVKNATGT